MKNVFSILLLGIVFSFSSCGDDDPEVPVCIDQLANTLDLCRGADADLTLWNFNNRELYCFFYGTCTEDSKAVIYDAECNEVCSLFGLSGNTLCEGIQWDGNAQRLETIYTF